MVTDERTWSKRDCVKQVLRNRRLFHHCLREGRPPSDELFLETHDELLPELREELTKSKKVSRLREEAALPVIAICPQCSSRIEVPSRRMKESVSCQSCSKTFQPDEHSTIKRLGPEPQAGQRVGPFLLIERVGKGGFGAVWKSLDTALHRTVAVKVALSVDDEDRQRFLREAESAAKLKHPNIVEVFQSGELFDPGETRGTLYIVSRFVDGHSLRVAMTREPIVIAHRAAALCLKLANAVAHAHDRDVVHRDLKPENILIDAAGEPHVTDFGLAKQLSRDTVMTREGMILGSPAYMSPEQAAGQGHDVGPTTDIYSLGAILYELLTGQKTFRGSNLSSVLRQVQEEMPPAALVLNDTVPLDLNTICMKCLEKKPADRFASAGELSEELQRFLEGVPIRSRPVGPATRAIRWCQRKPVLASLIGALAATVLVAVSLILMAWVSERAAHQVAERRRQEAVTSVGLAHESLGTAYLRLGATFKLFPEMAAAHADFLKQGAAQYEQLAALETDDPDLQLERGRVWLILGDVRQELGETEPAESAYRTAETLFSKLNASSPSRDRQGAVDAPLPDGRGSDLARSIDTELANTRGRLASIAIRQQDHEQAERLHNEAIESLTRLHQARPDDAYAEYSLAAAQLNHGGWLLERQQADDAKQTLQAAADHFDQLTQSNPKRLDWLTDYVRVLTLLGHQASGTGQHREAIQRIELGLKRLRQIESQAAGDVRFLEARSASHVYLAQALDNAGRTQDALAEYERSVVDLHALSRLAPTVMRFADELDLRQVDYAQALYDAGKLDRSEKELRLVEARLKEAIESAPDDVAVLYASGLCDDSLARVLADKGQNATAAEQAQQSLAAFRRVLAVAADSPPDHSLRLAISLIHHAEIAHKRGDDVRAASDFDEADSLLTRLRNADPNWHIATEIAAFSLRARGVMQLDSGDRVAARNSFTTAFEFWNGLSKSGHSPRFTHNLAAFLIEVPLIEQRDPPRAIELATRLTKLVPSNIRYQATLGAACSVAQQSPRAIQLLTLIPDEERRVRDWLYLAQAQSRNSKPDESRQSMQQAVSALTLEGPDNPALVRLKQETATLLNRSGSECGFRKP